MVVRSGVSVCSFENVHSRTLQIRIHVWVVVAEIEIEDLDELALRYVMLRSLVNERHCMLSASPHLEGAPFISYHNGAVAVFLIVNLSLHFIFLRLHFLRRWWSWG